MIDYTCEVEWCSTPTNTIYCKMHEGRYYKYGIPTPIVQCFGCSNSFQFTFPGTSFDKQGNGPQKHWCIECSSLINTYKDWLKPVNHAHILYYYKLTKIDYLKVLVRQNFSCAVCHKQNKKLVVDHDHLCCPENISCGKCVRGLICYDCNIFLGRIDTNPNIYQQAIEYLATFKVSK